MYVLGGGPRVVVSTSEFEVRFPVSAVWKKQKMSLPHPREKVSIMGSLRDREVACSASDRQGSNFESCVWKTVSSQSSHHPQEVHLAQFSLYVHKGGLKPDSFHFIFPCMFYIAYNVDLPCSIIYHRAYLRLFTFAPCMYHIAYYRLFTLFLCVPHRILTFIRLCPIYVPHSILTFIHPFSMCTS